MAIRSNSWTRVQGAARPLGVTRVEAEDAYNFALYSENATRVTLLLYPEDDVATPCVTKELSPFTNKTGRVWHCRVSQADLHGAHYYAYQVDGPRRLEEGHRFDPDKILLDPYATAIHFPPEASRMAASRPGSNAGKAPLGVLPKLHPTFDWSGDRQPDHTHDLVIYEMHVRGFTKRQNSPVSHDARGTFRGVIEMIPYLKTLGVTAVELLPVFQFDPAEGNYWGYMTLGFFALHEQYAAEGDPNEALDEFRSMVKALHAADIEVILDVVYNHTTEGGEDGPTYSFRGIDNATYYLLERDKRRYRNDAGTGNVFFTANPSVRALVLDSLRYWVTEMHVDGFRFDLASIFTRNLRGEIDLDDSPIISAIRADPVLADVRLIAEAWDISAYQLGTSYPGVTWRQWNGKYRDSVRSFVKSDGGLVPEVMRRLYGSDDLFPDDVTRSYRPYQSINFITAHDGFCLSDLVSYDRKHNEPNGENNRDGTNDNRSWNCGFEGENGAPPDVLELRRRQIKNFCTLLMVSAGTPMIVAGDEFANTQQGNNNPYNQDNDITWLDWSRRETNGDIFRFFQKMIAFRKAHPSIGRSTFWRGDVRWHGVGPDIDMSPGSRSLSFYLDGASENDDDLYVMINAFWRPLSFTLQEVDAMRPWKRVVDTFQSSPHDFLDGDNAETVGATYLVEPRSIVVLARR